MKLRLVLFGVCTLLVLPNVARGQSELFRATLRGIRAVSVSVAVDGEKDTGAGSITSGLGTRAGTEKDGLFDSRLQTMVELRLRQAGLSVLEPENPNDDATIMVAVSAVKSPDGLYAVHMELQVAQWAWLARNSHILSFAATWHATEVSGHLGSERIREGIESSIQHQVDEFLNDYFAENPKR
jgi:hypothetical protein